MCGERHPSVGMMASQNTATLLSSIPHNVRMQYAGNVMLPMVNQHQVAGAVFTTNNPNGMATFNGTTFLNGPDQVVANHLKVPFAASSLPPYPTPAPSTNALAAASGPTPVNDATLAILMDRLHGKSNQMKSWNDLSKSLKQSLLEKRPFVNDSNDKVQLQLALDTLQNNIEVKSLHSMVERLEAISRQMKLKFHNTANQCFISSDMYYVEVKFDAETGCVAHVKVVHTDAKNTANEVKSDYCLVAHFYLPGSFVFC